MKVVAFLVLLLINNKYFITILMFTMRLVDTSVFIMSLFCCCFFFCFAMVFKINVSSNNSRVVYEWPLPIHETNQSAVGDWQHIRLVMQVVECSPVQDNQRNSPFKL